MYYNCARINNKIIKLPLYKLFNGCQNLIMALFNENKIPEAQDLTVDVSSLRASYLAPQNILTEENIPKDPFKLFKDWFEEAGKCKKIEEPNAMCLATSTKNGIPSARYVLLKYFSSDGFTFFTNYCSRKGKELNENPNVAAVFYWEPLKKSIRIEGTTYKIAKNLSDDYFSSRPVDSQIGAWVSNQSCVISNRVVLEEENDRLKEYYKDKKIPRPEHWGGFIIKPRRIEFWQGQSNRLHDRILFRRPESDEKTSETFSNKINNEWILERLSP